MGQKPIEKCPISSFFGGLQNFLPKTMSTKPVSKFVEEKFACRNYPCMQIWGTGRMNSRNFVVIVRLTLKQLMKNSKNLIGNSASRRMDAVG